jgi:hypothetical protein
MRNAEKISDEPSAILKNTKMKLPADPVAESWLWIKACLAGSPFHVNTMQGIQAKANKKE